MAKRTGKTWPLGGVDMPDYGTIAPMRIPKLAKPSVKKPPKTESDHGDYGGSLEAGPVHPKFSGMMGD